MRGIFTIPNQLTFVRMLLVPVFITLLIYRFWLPALLVFTVASVTDAADGYLARKLNQRTPVGVVLDPLADKLMMDSSYLVLAEEGMLPPWLAILVVSRDVLLVGGVVLIKLFSDKGVKVEPSIFGKITTFFQILTVICVLGTKVFALKCVALLWLLYLLTAFFTVLSGYTYLRKGWEYLNGASQSS